MVQLANEPGWPIMENMGKWVYRDELQLAEINVPRAALQFARAIAYPDLSVATYMAQLHELIEEASDFISQNDPIGLQAERLSSFLFEGAGFRGNSTDYDDPRNNFLNDVLDRRLGSPISLSVVYIDIATRLGIPAFGINLPGHFIVGIREGEADIRIDSFHGGRRLDLMDCAQLIHLSLGYEGPLEALWFAPASARDVLTRMLANLRSNYVSSSSWASAAAVIQLIQQTRPDEPEHLRDLGLVYYHQGRLPQAAHYLNVYLQKSPNAADAEMIRNGMKSLLDEWVPMN